MFQPRLRSLGTPNSRGVLRGWCDSEVGEEARTADIFAHTRPSVVIEGTETVLVGAAPKLKVQANGLMVSLP